jgi:hypothetical protein
VPLLETDAGVPPAGWLRSAVELDSPLVDVPMLLTRSPTETCGAPGAEGRGPGDAVLLAGAGAFTGTVGVLTGTPGVLIGRVGTFTGTVGVLTGTVGVFTGTGVGATGTVGVVTGTVGVLTGTVGVFTGTGGGVTGRVGVLTGTGGGVTGTVGIDTAAFASAPGDVASAAAELTPPAAAESAAVTATWAGSLQRAGRPGPTLLPNVRPEQLTRGDYPIGVGA